MSSLTPDRLRLATDADRERVARIAELDSSRPIEGPALIGELEGVAVAVLCLETGRVVADPFRRTAALVATMRAEARRYGRAPWTRPSARLLALLRRPRSAFA